MTAISGSGGWREEGVNEFQSWPMAASATIYKTELACINTSGYLTNGSNTAGYMFAGIAQADVTDAAASAGATKCLCRIRGGFRAITSGASQAKIGAPVFLADNNTVTFTPGHVYVGICTEYYSATDIWVEFNLTDQVAAIKSGVYEATVEIGHTAANQTTIVPAWFNSNNGIFIEHFYGVVVEVPAGGDEDQPVVTLYDSADNSLGITIAFADGSGDTIGDKRLGVFLADAAAVADGAATIKCATAGRSLYIKNSTLAAGAGAAGKTRVCIKAVRY